MRSRAAAGRRHWATCGRDHEANKATQMVRRSPQRRLRSSST